jgi:transcriptional regulator with XRE-family HTH domain
VRKLRLRQRLTQEQLAERTGLAARHIQKIEAAEVNATLDTLSTLAEALGVNASTLLTAETE